MENGKIGVLELWNP